MTPNEKNENASNSHINENNIPLICRLYMNAYEGTFKKKIHVHVTNLYAILVLSASYAIIIVIVFSTDPKPGVDFVVVP